MDVLLNDPKNVETTKAVASPDSSYWRTPDAQKHLSKLNDILTQPGAGGMHTPPEGLIPTSLSPAAK